MTAMSLGIEQHIRSAMAALEREMVTEDEPTDDIVVAYEHCKRALAEAEDLSARIDRVTTQIKKLAAERQANT
jgi:hypothetical protein